MAEEEEMELDQAQKDEVQPPAEDMRLPEPRQPTESESDNDWYEIERIVSAKQVGSKVRYKVKWKGYPETEWVDEEDVTDEAKRKYHLKYTRQGKRRKHVIKQ